MPIPSGVTSASRNDNYFGASANTTDRQRNVVGLRSRKALKGRIPMRVMRRITWFTLVNLLVVAQTSLKCQSPAIPLLKSASANAPGGRLPKESRAELAAARARGESTVTLVLAAREGANEIVATAVK